MTESAGVPEAAKLFTELADDLKVGQPVLRSLRRIKEEFSDAPMWETIGAMADDIEKGSTLSQALEKYPHAFDEVVVLLVKSGEAAGMLDRLLPIVADYVSK